MLGFESSRFLVAVVQEVKMANEPVCFLLSVIMAVCACIGTRSFRECECVKA